MNTNRPHEELDHDERELARVVRALPGSEPSPALDLRILKAAQDAVATTPGKRSRRALWASSSAGSLWGIGTAAAAVLAVGVSWQLFMRGPTGNFPASRPVVVAEDKAQDRDATSVDFVTAAPKVQEQVATAETDQPVQLKERAAAAAEPARQRENEQSAGGPQPFLDEHVAVASKTEAQGQKSDDFRADSGLAANAISDNAAPASAPVATMAAPALEQSAPAAPAAPPPPMDAERSEQPALAKAATSTGELAGAAAPAGQSIAETPQAARHRVRADVRLYPESWLRKIRSRLQQGDTAGARASLKLFVEAYPQATVPDNLKPLLEE
jgi:hypothetical protein